MPLKMERKRKSRDVAFAIGSCSPRATRRPATSPAPRPYPAWHGHSSTPAPGHCPSHTGRSRPTQQRGFSLLALRSRAFNADDVVFRVFDLLPEGRRHAARQWRERDSIHALLNTPNPKRNCVAAPTPLQGGKRPNAHVFRCDGGWALRSGSGRMRKGIGCETRSPSEGRERSGFRPSG